MSTGIAAIIVAAGRSTRFGAPKLLMPLAGVPVIARAVAAFQAVPGIDRVIVVIGRNTRAQFETTLGSAPKRPPMLLIDGGERRQDSVLAGVRAAGDADIVVVHDGARPLVTRAQILASIEAVRRGADAAITAIPVTDTLKRITGDTVETVDRNQLWRAQTPQAFRRATLLAALEQASKDEIGVTDEATLIERGGGSVRLVPGSERNVKVTVPEDFDLLEAIMSTESQRPLQSIRTGIGYDVHRLVPGRELVIGGVAIASDVGLEGHSDADVLLHAVCDALLGACALGDIGQHFPPTDPDYRGISSLILLAWVGGLLVEHDFAIVNLDATIIAEKPRLAPHVPAMREAIAGTLELPTSAVGVKATTNEGLGFAGRREGIAAMAIATVRAGR